MTSKVTVESQTVLPVAVCEHLGIGPGDEIEYELRDGFAVLRPSRPRSTEKDDPFAVFAEWSSPADEAAYDDL
jgi:bifunctional DNA-binding transcriptional regulator/antitoxin component of YhaV-PrlF toxin-antitoxin module